MGSKRLTPMRVGKMASKCLLLLLYPGLGLGVYFSYWSQSVMFPKNNSFYLDCYIY